MQSHFHAIVWIDHHQAKVFHFNANEVDRAIVRPHDRTVHLHHKANTIGSGHVAADKEFLGRVTEAVAGAGTILIVGPAGAKTELASHLTAHAPGLSARGHANAFVSLEGGALHRMLTIFLRQHKDLRASASACPLNRGVKPPPSSLAASNQSKHFRTSWGVR